MPELQGRTRTGATVQHDVPPGGRAYQQGPRLPSTGDRPGRLPELQAGVRGVAPETSDGARDRRAGVPKRDQPAPRRIPDARIPPSGAPDLLRPGDVRSRATVRLD